MKKMFPKCFLLALFVCTIMVSCSDDDDDNITQSDIEGFWEYGVIMHREDMCVDWIPNYLEFTSDGKVHQWTYGYLSYAAEKPAFRRTNSGTYSLDGAWVIYKLGDREFVKMKKKGDILTFESSNKDYTSIFTKITKPDGLSYE